MKIQQWFHEFRKSWQDKNFICAMATFIITYVVISSIGLLISHELYTAIISGIAGWQVASWSTRLAPKIKEIVFKNAK